MIQLLRPLRAAFALAAIVLVLAACGGSPDRIGVSAVGRSDVGMIERVFVVTSRKPVEDRNVLFSGERSPALHFADVEVSVPDQRRPGEIAFPKRKPDLHRQFAAIKIGLTDDETLFTQRLKDELATYPEDQRTVFITVHGYNTSFAGGLFRQAQLAHDYGVSGVSLHYSWPSADNAALYLYDRDSADFARAGLVRMLRIAYAAEPTRIIIVAHSMGAALTMEALRDLSISGAGHIVRLVEALVLASPDIDADLFQSELASFQTRPGVIAVIVSKKDRALQLSSGIRGGETRVGLAADADRLRAQGVVVVDASKVKDGDDPTGHYAFSRSPELIRMLRGSGLSIESLAQAGRTTASSGEGIGAEGGRLAAIVRLGKKVIGED